MLSFGRNSILALVFILCVGCAANKDALKVNEYKAKKANAYNTELLAEKWRAEVRRRPINPYEGAYRDNDEEYTAPNGSYKVKRKYKHTEYPARRYPNYDPDADNTYLDPQHYPLYMDE